MKSSVLSDGVVADIGTADGSALEDVEWESAGSLELDPATLLVRRLFESYIYERSQISRGAVPTDEMAPYFDSPVDYDKALKGTGAVPFLCSSEAPDAVDTPNPPKVVGSTETINFTSGFSGGAPPGSGTTTKLGQGQVTIDLSTMKIKAITCL